MPEPLAYLNGQLIPASQAMVPVYDAGFVLGATVTEQLRTFGGELFCVPEHMARLENSLKVSGIQPDVDVHDIAEIGQRLVTHNHTLIDPADDLGLCIFITPGPYAAMAEGDKAGPSVGIHTYQLPFHLWADAYQQGVSLVTTAVQQVPAACWSPELKCRSRMHYYLADRAAAEKEAGARALLLDASGMVCETSTANILAHFANRGLVSPPEASVLPGISLHSVKEFARRHDLHFTEQAFSVDELARADEALLTSTPNCLLPVTRLNGAPIGAGKPGPIFQQLLSAWNEFVGFDIAEQARRFAKR